MQQDGDAESKTDRQRRLAAAILDRLYVFALERGIPAVIQILPSGGYTSAYSEHPLTDVFPYEYFDAKRPDFALLLMIDVLTPYIGKVRIKYLNSHFH